MSIDVVIPYRLSPLTNSVELRYCLRSIAKHLANVGNIFIIGEIPDYVKQSENLHYIPFAENNWYTYLTRNIHNKLFKACYTSRVSDTFLYMNDDHFLLKSLDAYDMPYYHGGKVWGGTGKYVVTVQNTLNVFPDADNFDVHTPMLIQKEKYVEHIGALNWNTPFGYAIKSSYCAANKIAGEPFKDYKINHRPSINDLNEILGLPLFSLGDKALTTEMIGLLNFIYPVKSKYEK